MDAPEPTLAHRGGTTRIPHGPPPPSGLQRRAQRVRRRQTLRSPDQPVRPGRRLLSVRRQRHSDRRPAGGGVRQPPADGGTGGHEEGQGRSGRQRIHGDRARGGEPLQGLQREEPADRDDVGIPLVGRKHALPDRPNPSATAHTALPSSPAVRVKVGPARARWANWQFAEPQVPSARHGHHPRPRSAGPPADSPSRGPTQGDRSVLRHRSGWPIPCLAVPVARTVSAVANLPASESFSQRERISQQDRHQPQTRAWLHAARRYVFVERSGH